jgi:hypothetical protein
MHNGMSLHHSTKSFTSLIQSGSVAAAYMLICAQGASWKKIMPLSTRSTLTSVCGKIQPLDGV